MKRKPSILMQLIAGFTAILLVVMSATGLITYYQTSRMALGQTSKYLMDSVVHLSGKLDNELQEYDKLIQTLSFSDPIQNHMADPIHSGISDLQVSRYMNDSNGTIGLESNIMIVDLYGKDYRANSSMDFLWGTEETLQQQPWYAEVNRLNGRMLWFSDLVWINGYKAAVVGVRTLNHWETVEKLGMIAFAFPVDAIGTTVDQVELGVEGKIQVVDPFGDVVYSTNRLDIGSPAPKKVLDKLKNDPSEMFSLTLDDAPTYISHASSEYSGWTILAYIGEDEIYKDVLRLQEMIIWIGGAGLAAGLLFLTIYAWTIVRPIRFLAKRFEMIDDGRLRPFKGKLRNREVSGLYDSFNRMLSSLNQTIRDLSDKQISEREAQFVALRAQFRPHFLYNTLNTIYWALIGKKDTEAAAEMVQQLSELLRYSIQPGPELTTIREDVAQLQRYIALQKARYGDKLETEIDVGEELLEASCMKLLLQPIVENAMTHGLEGVKRDRWRIRIRIMRDGNNIRFVVEDNGKGMSEREIEEIMDPNAPAEDNPLHTGIGLPNLQQRLQLVHGKAYGIRLSASELGGLKVTVTIPLLPVDDASRESEGGDHTP